MRRLVLSLAVGIGGMALLLAGLAWDALLHADDPGLAAREGLFTVSNPGHLLLGIGIGLTLLALLSAGDAALSLRAGGRWGVGGVRAGAALASAVVVAATAATGVWAARAGHAHGEGADGSHGHEAAAPVAAAGGVAGDGVAGVAGGVGGPMAGGGAGHAAHDDGHGSSGHHAHAGAGGAEPTAAERAAAEKLLADTEAAAGRWASQAAAKAAGYRAITPVWNGLQHWHHQGFHTDGRILDPAAPEELIYASTSRGPVLVAAMYLMPAVGEPGPRVGGPLTTWHAHDDLCFTTDGRVVGFARPSCPDGSFNVPTPEMLHVWVVDNPEGPFAENMAPAAIQALAEG